MVENIEEIKARGIERQKCGRSGGHHSLALILFKARIRLDSVGAPFPAFE